MLKLIIKTCLFAVVLLFTTCKDETKVLPKLRILNPADNYSTIKADMITITVQASDPDGLIYKAEIFIDNKLVYSTETAPYDYIWYTEKEKHGSHIIKAIVTDDEGNTNESFVTVYLNIVAPEIKTLPMKGVSANYAIAEANITNMGTPTVDSAGICWSTYPNPTLTDKNIRVHIGDQNFKCLIGNLQENKKYYVRAFIQITDSIIYGEDVSFITSSAPDTGSFIDTRDGNRYKWVTIGSQTWMAENLRYNASGCITDSIYGNYYHDITNICPIGWHLPTYNEWNELLSNFGGSYAGMYLKEQGTNHWKAPNIVADNTTTFFNVLPGGSYFYLTEERRWGRCCIQENASYQSYDDIRYEKTSITFKNNIGYMSLSHDFSKYVIDYFNVRCIKDK